MILLVSLIAGLIAGFLRAWLTKQSYVLPTIHRIELVFLAFLPQALTFFIPQTGAFVSNQWAAFILPTSLGILILFAWQNRHIQGSWLLGIGLLLNLTVIATNGGLMPISPATLTVIYGEQSEAYFDNRDFGGKSIVLAPDETHLEWLSDRFTLPEQLPIQFAYSLGDVFLVFGAFWALWAGGTSNQQSPSAETKRQLYSS